MEGVVAILFSPITIFVLLFFAFGIKNLITRHFFSAIVYLLLSLCITLAGAWIWATVSPGPKPIIVKQAEKESSNHQLEDIATNAANPQS